MGAIATVLSLVVPFMSQAVRPPVLWSCQSRSVCVSRSKSPRPWICRLLVARAFGLEVGAGRLLAVHHEPGVERAQGLVVPQEIRPAVAVEVPERRG